MLSCCYADGMLGYWELGAGSSELRPQLLLWDGHENTEHEEHTHQVVCNAHEQYHNSTELFKLWKKEKNEGKNSETDRILMPFSLSLYTVAYVSVSVSVRLWVDSHAQFRFAYFEAQLKQIDAMSSINLGCKARFGIIFYAFFSPSFWQAVKFLWPPFFLLFFTHFLIIFTAFSLCSLQLDLWYFNELPLWHCLAGLSMCALKWC